MRRYNDDMTPVVDQRTVTPTANKKSEKLGMFGFLNCCGNTVDTDGEAPKKPYYLREYKHYYNENEILENNVMVCSD